MIPILPTAKSQYRCAIIAAIITGVSLLLPFSADAQAYANSRTARPMSDSETTMGRTFNPDTQGTLNLHPRVPMPRIQTKADWGGAESSGTMRAHKPTQITVHHEGSPRVLTPDRDPKQILRNLQIYGWRAKNWADIPYHYLIDTSGTIYACRDVNFAGDTNTKYDPASHLLVCVMGNYDQQSPTTYTLAAMCDLIAYQCDARNIDPATIGAHLDYANTGCPGRYMFPFVASGFFEREVRQRIRAAYAPPKPVRATSVPSPR